MNKILSIEKIDRFGRVIESGRDDGRDYGIEDSVREMEGAAHAEPSLRNLPAGRRGRGSVRVRVTPEEGEPFTISGGRAARLGLRAGEDLAPEVYQEILQELRASCMQRCGTLLGSRDYPERRLRTKLEDAGYPASVIEECMDKLRQARYLDDRRYAQTYVRSHLSDRSRLRIRRDLSERGIPDEYIEEAFAEIEEETDPDQVQLDQIRRLLKKRGYDPGEADYAMRQKTMAFLHRKGYETDLIRRAMEDAESGY